MRQVAEILGSLADRPTEVAPLDDANDKKTRRCRRVFNSNDEPSYA